MTCYTPLQLDVIFDNWYKWGSKGTCPLGELRAEPLLLLETTSSCDSFSFFRGEEEVKADAHGKVGRMSYVLFVDGPLCFYVGVDGLTFDACDLSDSDIEGDLNSAWLPLKRHLRI